MYKLLKLSCQVRFALIRTYQAPLTHGYLFSKRWSFEMFSKLDRGGGQVVSLLALYGDGPIKHMCRTYCYTFSEIY